MSHKVASLFTDSGINLFIDGQSYTVANDHPNIDKIKSAISRHDYDSVAELMDVRSAVRKWMSRDGNFKLENDQIVFQGRSFSPEVTDKVLSMIDAGSNAEPLFNFLRKIRLNPSAIAQGELLLFCVANNFMIHEDGDILAYKSVRSDYMDIHSGTVDNHVGKIVTVDRGAVDDVRTRTCSFGLHFASHEYATTWHGLPDAHLLVMKINPADVVSIPSDYNNQKGRCCRYEVYSEIAHDSHLPRKEVYTASDCGHASDSATRISELAGEIFDLEERIEDLEAEQNDLQDNAYKIESLGGIISEDDQTRMSELDDEIDNLTTDCEHLRCQLDRLEFDSDENASDLADDYADRDCGDPTCPHCHCS